MTRYPYGVALVVLMSCAERVETPTAVSHVVAVNADTQETTGFMRPSDLDLESSPRGWWLYGFSPEQLEPLPDEEALAAPVDIDTSICGRVPAPYWSSTFGVEEEKRRPEPHPELTSPALKQCEARDTPWIRHFETTCPTPCVVRVVRQECSVQIDNVGACPLDASGSMIRDFFGVCRESGCSADISDMTGTLTCDGYECGMYRLANDEVTCTPDGCSRVCPPGAGACEPDLLCRPLVTEANCGTCGNVCGDGRSCLRGACFCTADTTSNPRHCGACDQACPDGWKCEDSVCDCDADLLTDESHCGACGSSCAAGEVCLNGVCECSADLSTDNNNCGMCGLRCDSSARCVNGQCRCFNPMTRANCGVCGVACPFGQDCIARVCQSDWGSCNPPGFSSSVIHDRVAAGTRPVIASSGPTAIVAWVDRGTIAYSRSTDGGHSFALTAPIVHTQAGHPRDVEISNDSGIGWLIVWSDDEPTGRVHAVRSVDDGMTWSAPVTLGGVGAVAPKIASGGPGRWLVAWTDSSVWAVESFDGGSTFNQPVEIPDCPSEVRAASGSPIGHYVVGCGNGPSGGPILVFSRLGVWQSVALDVRAGGDVRDVLYTDPFNVFAVTGDVNRQSVHASRDDGVTWRVTRLNFIDFRPDDARLAMNGPHVLAVWQERGPTGTEIGWSYTTDFGTRWAAPLKQTSWFPGIHSLDLASVRGTAWFSAMGGEDGTFIGLRMDCRF